MTPVSFGRALTSASLKSQVLIWGSSIFALQDISSGFPAAQLLITSFASFVKTFAALLAARISLQPNLLSATRVEHNLVAATCFDVAAARL